MAHEDLLHHELMKKGVIYHHVHAHFNVHKDVHQSLTLKSTSKTHLPVI